MVLKRKYKPEVWEKSRLMTRREEIITEYCVVIKNVGVNGCKIKTGHRGRP